MHLKCFNAMFILCVCFFITALNIFFGFVCILIRRSVFTSFVKLQPVDNT
jgi:hypothetical protein